MTDRALSSSPGGLSTLRQLRVLVAVLIISNIALGIFAFCFLRSIDRKYSTLINQTVPSLNELQTLTAVSMNAMRNTNANLFGESGQTRVPALKQAREAIRRDRELRSSALSRPWLLTREEDHKSFQEAGEAFTDGAERILALLESGDTQQAARQREETLRPIFDRYVAATTKAADELEAQSLGDSNTLTARTSHLATMLLGVGGWPVMLLGTFLLITALLSSRSWSACSFAARKRSEEKAEN